MFAFVSGYVLGNSVQARGMKVLAFDSCVIKKVKRLLFPCLFFSVVYFLLMGNNDMTALTIVGKIINGYGHLWYLPMLFWCFVFTCVVERIRIKPKYMIPLLLIAACSLSLKYLPFGISAAMYYMLFFYIGYMLKCYAIDLDKYFAWKYVLLFGVVYSIVFVGLQIFTNAKVCDGGDSFTIMLVNGALNKLLHIICSSTALAFIYLAVNTALKTGKIRIESWMINISALCYGVYIYHQMVIDFAYYRLGWLETLPSLVLPWAGFVTALSLSLLFAHITLKTRFGRLLIG